VATALATALPAALATALPAVGLVTTAQMIAAVTAQTIAAVNATVPAAVNAAVAGLATTAQMAGLVTTAQLNAALQRSEAISFNNSALAAEQTLRPVPNLAGTLPEAANPPVWFPPTKGHMNMNGTHTNTTRVNDLLTFYSIVLGVPNPSLKTKCDALSRHIGLR
jgi:hypothetical protein